MSLPFVYTLRNLYSRKLTALLTALGMALVVYVFTTMLMVAEGLERTLISTGHPENLILLRQGAASAIQSTVERDQASIVASYPEIAAKIDGARAVSKEVEVLVGLPKRGSGAQGNVTLRGLSLNGASLRPQVSLAEGRWFQPGSSEIVLGNHVTESFERAEVGGKLEFAGRGWTVVGIFDAGSTAYAAEIWADAEQLMQAFRRNAFSVVVFRLASSEEVGKLAARVENDPRMNHRVKPEIAYYAEQSDRMATFLRIFGVTLSIVFSVGAVVGAAITMHAAVAHRTREIGTLRAIGFQRASILLAFLLESLLFAIVGGMVGLGLAATMQFLTISTTNWQTFSEIAFSLSLTPGIVAKSIAFALLMGLLGGFLPAFRAAQLDIVDSLRAA